MMMKTILYIAFALTILLSGAAFSANSTIDGFEYKSITELQKNWTISNSGFADKFEYLLVSGKIKEGKKALQLNVPAASNASSVRIDLDVTPDVNFSEVKQVVFFLYMDNPQTLSQTGLHVGDATWSNHFSKFGYVGYVKGWQEVIVSRESFVVGGGNPSWDSAVQMRLTFWFTPNSPASTIIIDKVQWNTRRQRSDILNRKWYE